LSGNGGIDMRVYELYEVSSQPKKNNHRYGEYKVYNNALYMEAECIVENNLEEDVSDEAFDEMVEGELEIIMETLKVCGRYPETGIPKFVMY
jgi:hypothetical protein